MKYPTLTLLTAALAAATAPAAGRADETAARAKAVLEKYCYRCHGQNGNAEGGFGYALDAKKLAERRKVVPGDAGKSRLLTLVRKGEMPPEDEKPRPTEADAAALEQWIAAGAAAFPEAAPAARRPLAALDVLSAVHADLATLRPGDRPYQRYFSLAHLHNHPQVSDEDLRWHRAALSKVANSLSWQPRIVAPRAVDAAGAVLALDLRDFGWARPGLWEQVLRLYPYGLRLEDQPDVRLRDLAGQVRAWTGTDLPVLRSDWFVATASRPPLYHALLDLPTHASRMESQLRVDVNDNFLRNVAVRAGFARSGVSTQNRLVERHPAAYGAYWKSYDFKSNDGRGNLFQFPLGPAFKGNPFADQAFEHAGGELIFNLPNHLQGYLLVNEKDERIDEGPTDVVADTQKTAGTTAVVNGLSCMACHKHGMIREGVKDTVRDGMALGGRARLKVQDLYVEEGKMNGLLLEDEDRFLRALDLAAGPFLKVGADKGRPIRDFTDEPAGRVARAYLKDLTLADAAAELGVAPDRLQAAIRANHRLKELGLGTLAEGGTVKRDAWASLKHGVTPFQLAAQELDLGSPHLPF